MHLRALTAPARTIRLGLIALSMGFLIEAQKVHSEPISADCFLINDGIIEIDTDFLLLTGRLLPISIDTITPQYYGVSVAEILPIIGKPVIDLPTYNLWKSNGLLGPMYIRSRASFYVPSLQITYVIVGIKGKTDPNPPVTITSAPQSTNGVVGGATVFSCSAEPSTYVSYQWRFKNKDIPGQASGTLILENLAKTNAGLYTCAVSTGSKPVITKPALLRVLTPVSVKTQPKSQTTKAGASVVFRVTAQGTGPFTYQWFFNGYAITGETKSFLSLSKVTDAQAGDYLVSVLNSVSITQSVAATLTVTP